MGLLFDQVMFEMWRDGMEPYFRSAPVYEASNCMFFINDMHESERLKLARIPRRPPHPRLWVEVTSDVESEVRKVNNTQAFLFEERNPDSFREIYLNPRTLQIQNFLAESAGKIDFRTAHLYSGVGYHRVNQRRGPGTSKIGWAYQLGANFLLWFSEDWINTMAFCARTEGDDAHSHIFTLSNRQETLNLFASQFASFSNVFALLHCRNIIAETVKSADEPKRIRIGGEKRKPPRKCSYHVLRLELPNSIRPRGQPSESDEERAKVRLHLCRGHFKNLQHERYKDKGWHWWPAHWRGDEELGTVDKIYQPRPAAV